MLGPENCDSSAVDDLNPESGTHSVPRVQVQRRPSGLEMHVITPAFRGETTTRAMVTQWWRMTVVQTNETNSPVVVRTGVAARRVGKLLFLSNATSHKAGACSRPRRRTLKVRRCFLMWTRSVGRQDLN